MRKHAGILWIIMLLVCLGGWQQGHAAFDLSLAQQISEQLWERLLLGGPPPLRVAGESLRSEHLVAQFYTQRLFWPAWSSATGLVPQVESLLQALREAEVEGLRPRDYHLARVESLRTEVFQAQRPEAPGQAAKLAQLDLLLTDAMLAYGSHLLYGRLTPRASSVMFDTSPETVNLVHVLRQGLETNRLAEVFQSLLPRHADYAKLRKALGKYRQTPGSEGRVRQILQNMERWRWLPQELGQRYVMVDVIGYTLDVMEREQSVLNMRVVVGKPSWPTPVLSSAMSHVVLSPDWRVPPNIASRELLPILRANPGYLAQNNMRLISGSRIIDPRSVNWSSMSTKHFPYSLRQEPGPRNPLGTVKFLFPNRFQVYLHDTSSRRLFAQTERALSHGCIRVERPTDLAEYALRGVISRERIVAGMGQRTSRTVSLAEPLPTYIVYRTVLVKEDGSLQFRPDIYGYDERQARETS